MQTPASRPPPQVKCPQCQTLSVFAPSNAYRPFCSERCKLIDFGAWASEQFAVSEPLQDPTMVDVPHTRDGEPLH